jgi:hypothetical protein
LAQQAGSPYGCAKGAHPRAKEQWAMDNGLMTVAQFCDRNAISESFYFKLRSQRMGPQEMRFGKAGKAVRISFEAEKEWRLRASSPPLTIPWYEFQRLCRDPEWVRRLEERKRNKRSTALHSNR